MSRFNHHPQHGNVHQQTTTHTVTASGDGAVAAGGDIRHSTVTTGHDNQVGNGNIAGHGNVAGHGNQAVTGSHDTTSFGSGHATTTTVGGAVHVGDGAAFGSGGSASVDNSDHSLRDVGNSYTDKSVNDSFKDSGDHSVHDSGNIAVDLSAHDSHNDNSHHTFSQSFDDSSDHHIETDNSLHHVGNIHF